MPNLETLIARLGLPFQQLWLLESALTHASFRHEQPDRVIGLENSERIEFLGDAVLNYLAADVVYRRFPEASEGALTVLRSELIKTATLAAFANELGLGAYVRLSKGEERSGARQRPALLADTFEAVLAAIYLDQGLAAAHTFLLPLLEAHAATLAADGLATDYKSQLQRRIQAERNITPLYRVLSESGPEHRRSYQIEVLAGDESLGVGSGLGKQVATQNAAQAALKALDTPPTDRA